MHISGDLSSKRSKAGTSNGRACRAMIHTGTTGSSTNHNVGLSNEYFPWHAFNELPHYADSIVGVSHKYVLERRGEYEWNDGRDTFNHEWIQVKFPQAIRVSYLRMRVRPGVTVEGSPKLARVRVERQFCRGRRYPRSGLSYASGDVAHDGQVGGAASYDYWRVCFTEITGALPSFRWMRSGS